MSRRQLGAVMPWLGDLPESSTRFLESLAEELTIPPGTVVFEEDQPADTFYVIVEGRVGLEVLLHTRPAVLIETIGPGELFGLSWLFPPHRWNWRARTLTEVKALSFNAEAVRNRCASDPDLAVHIYRAVAKEAVRRLHEARLRLLDLYPGLRRDPDRDY